MAYQPSNTPGTREYRLDPFTRLSQQIQRSTQGVEIGRVKLNQSTDGSYDDMNISTWDGEMDQTVTIGRTAIGPEVSSQIDAAQSAAQSALNQAGQAQTASQTALDSRQAVLKLVSDRGTTFKNSALSTAIRVTIFYGQTTITDSSELASTFGATAYLEWRWRRIDDVDWKTILSTDSHISDGGFTFTVSPDDVDAQTVFSATLNI